MAAVVKGRLVQQLGDARSSSAGQRRDLGVRVEHPEVLQLQAEGHDASSLSSSHRGFQVGLRSKNETGRSLR